MIVAFTWTVANPVGAVKVKREESIAGQIRECTALVEKNGVTVLRQERRLLASPGAAFVQNASRMEYIERPAVE